MSARKVLADALREHLGLTEVSTPTADSPDIVAATLLTALSERGYTIVASDRLAGLDPELLARALWGWGFDATGPVIRDDVKGPTDSQRRMARKLVNEYERLALSRSEATEKGAPRE